MCVELEFIKNSHDTAYTEKYDNDETSFHCLPPFLKNSCNTSRAANKLPNTPDTARMIACHPNLPRLFTIRLLEPMDTPRIKSNRNIVREIVFSVFCKILQLRNPYPIPIPKNMVDIIENIIVYIWG